MEIDNTGNPTIANTLLALELYFFSLSITYDEDPSLSNNVFGLQGMHGSYPYLKSDIGLNPNQQNASKEFASSTIIHELFHTYINALVMHADFTGNIHPIVTEYENLINNENMNQAEAHHEIIAINFRDDIESTLKALYPNLSDKDANALSWGGLQNFGDWDQINNKNQVNTINNEHKNANSGSPCND